MKKQLLSVMAALMIVLLLAGCNSGKKGPSGKVDENGVTVDEITLTFWHYEDETTINMLAEKFMKKYPNITVECRVIEDMSTDLSAAAAAGTFPDVFEGTDSDTALANQYWVDISE